MRIKNYKKYRKLLGNIDHDPLTEYQRKKLIYAKSYPWLGWHFLGINLWCLAICAVFTLVEVLLGNFH